MWRTTSGLLKVSSASSPPKPLALVAIGKLWKAEKFSTLIQDGQDVVRPQPAPDGAQPLRRRADLRPGLRRHFRIEPGGAEQVLVVVEDRRRGVERKRQHVAGNVGVVAGDRRQIGRRRERLGLVAHQFEHRIDRALRRHHGRGGDLVDLNDRGLAARTKREDRRRHRLGVVALVGRHDAVVGLRGVEIGGELLELLAELARHRVPPMDLGGRLRRRHQHDDRRTARRTATTSKPIFTDKSLCQNRSVDRDQIRASAPS